MNRFISEDEVYNEMLATFGSDLGGVFHALYNEVVWLHDKWREYCELFETEERVELLNRAASRFFGSFQELLWEDILLHMARVTDSPKSAGKPSLTIRRLPDLISNIVLRHEVSLLVDEAVNKVEFARDWRHRRIAHRDLALALEQETRALASANSYLVNESLSLIAQVLNKIHEDRQYFDGQSLSFDIIGGPGDAIDLLRVLQDGVNTADERKRRFQSGRILPDDLTGDLTI